MTKNSKIIFGEYDPPLPTVSNNPTKEDREKLKKLFEKYEKLAKTQDK